MGSGNDIDHHVKTAGAAQPVFLPLFIILLVTVVTQLAHLAYNSSQDFQSIVLPSVLYLSLTTIPLGWLGIWFGRRIGLGTPLLAALLQKQPGAWRKLRNDTRIAMLLGLSMGAALVLLRIVTTPYLPPEIPVFGHRGVIGGLIVSAAAAVSEEVWFRLGIMTMLLWSFTRLMRHNSIRPSVEWPVIILVSVGF